MIRVLIVDDEDVIRRGIRNKIHKLNSNYEVIGEASDGEEAFAKAIDLRPDVIITDIKMPKLDGLMLIEKLAKQLEETQFIIVSGYQDFSYAQKALKLGVCDYLLKPIDNAEFQGLLDRLTEQFQLREQNSVLIRSLKQQAEDLAFQQKNRDFSRLLSHLTDTADVPEWYGIGSEAPIVMCIIKIKTTGAIFSAANEALATIACGNLFEQIPSSQMKCVVFHREDEHDRFYGLMVGAVEQQEIEEWVQQAISKAMAELDTHICAAIGEAAPNLTFLENAFDSAKRVADQSTVYINRPLLNYADYRAIEGNEYSLPSSEKKRIESALMQGDYASVQAAVKSVFQTLSERRIIRSKINAVCSELFGIMIHVLKAQKLFTTSDLATKDVDSYISACETLDDIRNYLLKHALYLCEEAKRNDAESGKHIITKIVAYIEEQYFTNIKLNDIAEEHFINTSYLSQLFLQETSKNFKQFLCEVRINNAKNLLENTSLPVTQVAELVGYNDRSYFSNVFTKFVGQTPAQYRKENSSRDDEE